MFSLISNAVYILLLAQYAVPDPLSNSKILSNLQNCPADSEEKWSYRGRNGPMYWGENYPICYGESQSPIEIETETVKKDENLAKLNLNNYDVAITKATIENNGHSIELIPTDGVERSIVVNGDTYTLRQLHFHWGDKYDKGSEHTLNGKQYAMELHLVHMSGEKIAVVGVFLQEQRTKNEELQKIVEKLSELLYKDTETELETPLTLNGLLPENPASYYRYNGSLTTPSCSEGVTWSVLTDVINVGKSQMSEFRKLYSTTQEKAESGCKLSNNYRPTQPLNERQVLLSQ